MKYLWLLFFSIIFTQCDECEYCYNEEQVVELANIIEECQFKEQVHFQVEQNLSAQIKDFELIVAKNDSINVLLESQIELKNQLIKEIKPKWHENKYLWFGYGIVAVILPTWVLGNVK